MKMKTLSKTTVFFSVFFLLCSVPADAGPIKKAWKWITNLAKPVHGTYHDGESNKTPPLTTFDRGVFSGQRELIRAKVINEENGYKAKHIPSLEAKAF